MSGASSTTSSSDPDDTLQSDVSLPDALGLDQPRHRRNTFQPSGHSTLLSATPPQTPPTTQEKQSVSRRQQSQTYHSSNAGTLSTSVRARDPALRQTALPPSSSPFTPSASRHNITEASYMDVTQYLPPVANPTEPAHFDLHDPGSVRQYIDRMRHKIQVDRQILSELKRTPKPTTSAERYRLEQRTRDTESTLQRHLDKKARLERTLDRHIRNQVV